MQRIRAMGWLSGRGVPAVLKVSLSIGGVVVSGLFLTSACFPSEPLPAPMPMMVEVQGETLVATFPVCAGAHPIAMTAGVGGGEGVMQYFLDLDEAVEDTMWTVVVDPDLIATESVIGDVPDIDRDGWNPPPPLGTWALDFETSDGYGAVVLPRRGHDRWVVGVSEVELPVDWSDGNAVAEIWCANRQPSQ